MASANDVLLATTILVTVSAVVVRVSIRRQQTAEPGEPADDPFEAGPEPPAIVNFLTNACRVTRESAAATAIDLADRGVLAIDALASGRSIVRIRPGPHDLDGYELLVLDALRDKAIDRELPASAASLGADDLSRSWWGRYGRLVEDDAVRRGLAARPGWSPMRPAGLATLALPPLLAFATFGGSPERAFRTVGTTLLVLASLAPVLILLLATHPSFVVLTDDGRRVAGRWLGARARIAEAALEAHGPAGVRMWGRHLANAAAMGLAPDVVAELPYGTEDLSATWSSAGGRWRPVRIRSWRWRPAWGRRPSRVLVGGAVIAVLGALVSLLLRDLDGPPIAGAAAGVLAVLAVLGVPFVVAGLVDLVAERHVEGEVIRLTYVQPPPDAGFVRLLQGHGWFLVVDDGRSRSLPAWEVETEDAAELAVGQRVRVEVTPCLGYVVGYEPVG